MLSSLPFVHSYYNNLFFCFIFPFFITCVATCHWWCLCVKTNWGLFRCVTWMCSRFLPLTSHDCSFGVHERQKVGSWRTKTSVWRLFVCNFRYSFASWAEKLFNYVTRHSIPQAIIGTLLPGNTRTIKGSSCYHQKLAHAERQNWDEDKAYKTDNKNQDCKLHLNTDQQWCTPIWFIANSTNTDSDTDVQTNMVKRGGGGCHQTLTSLVLFLWNWSWSHSRTQSLLWLKKKHV